MRKIILLGFILLSFSVNAQDNPEVITASNISHLQSVAQIDFADFGVDFDTGMFWMNDSATRILVEARENVLLVNNMTEIFVRGAEEEGFPIDWIATVFDRDEDLTFSLYQIDGMTYLGGTAIQFEGIPLDLWTDDKHGLFVETINDEGLPVFWEYSVAYNAPIVQEESLEQYTIPLSPEDVVRIGRIPLPYMVTSSLDGIVRLYSLDYFLDGYLIYEVDNSTGQPSVFGAINNPPTHLVWRDNANESLYLLNFEAGENRRIAELNGAYAQWFFLSPDASVILAVDLDFEQNVVAWDVATGERTDLGQYRDCSRPQPDMARFSSDGTTLVIGCDTGLDIWRIAD